MYGNKRHNRRPFDESLAIALWQQENGEDNSIQMHRLKRNLLRALERELTQRQRDFVTMYFIDGLSMTQIASAYGVNVSTVSRTIKRGKYRLEKCLRYSF